MEYLISVPTLESPSELLPSAYEAYADRFMGYVQVFILFVAVMGILGVIIRSFR